MSALMAGVTNVDANDPASRKSATARMIANMIGGRGRFGKSVFDPSFKGQGGIGRTGH
jgi:hypothetical protein